MQFFKELNTIKSFGIATRISLLSILFLLGSPALAQQGERYERVSIAHGGAGEHLPFSSWSALKAAIPMRPDYIETDVQLSWDGVLVCFHDLVLENRTNVEQLFPDRYTEITLEGETVKTWYVNDFSLDGIKTLDYGSWFAPEYSNERIVTF